METAVNSLPDEILERIFSYCTHSDLVRSIQNVCWRWREVVQSAGLWKDVIYCPEPNTRYEHIVKMLEISPKLQNIILRYNYDVTVLQAITDNCAELRKLEISVLPGIDINFIRNLQKKCSKIEYLKIPHPMLTELDKCEVVVNFNNLKFLHLSGDPPTNFSTILKPVADYCRKLEHLNLDTSKFIMNDLRYLLTMSRDTLRTLGVCCCNDSDECVLPALTTCELQSLSLFDYSLCPRLDAKVEHFRRLKTVKALSIRTFSSKDDFKQIFQNENMAQLMELGLDDSEDFDNDDAEVIVRNCPLLKKLSLKNLINMNDATLKIMTNLKELSCLTISNNDCVTDNGVLHLQEVKGLVCLRISWCKVGIGNIVKLRTLRHLSLEDQDLAEFAWHLIPHHLENLQCLYLCRCRNVDMCAIEKVKNQLPCLKVKVLKCS